MIRYSNGRCELTMEGLRRLVASAPEVPAHARIEITRVGTFTRPGDVKPVPVELFWRAVWDDDVADDPFIAAARAESQAAYAKRLKEEPR